MPKRYKMINLTNATVVTPHQQIRSGCVVMRGEKIEYVGRGSDLPTDIREDKEYKVIDVKGAYIIPGLIDTHLHGGGGVDCMDGGTECIRAVAKIHAAGGITSFLPTTVSCPHQQVLQFIEDVRTVMGDSEPTGARVLGAHLEGPYLALAMAGAHDCLQVRQPDPNEYLEWLENSDVVRRMTVAPELPGAMRLGRELSSRGIIASMGHTGVEFADVQVALDHGYSCVTHYLCSISQSTRLPDRKIAGLAEAALAYDDVTIELIADNMHLPPGVPMMAYKCKGPNHTILTTDSIRAAGMPDGEYVLGDAATGRRIIVDQGVAWIPDRTSFAGSVSLGCNLLRNVVETSHVPLHDAVRMMTFTPASLLGIQGKKGVLAKGADADVVVMNSDYSVEATFVGGRVVYERHG